MESLVAGDLRINVDDTTDPQAIRLHWLGMSTDRQPEKVLGPFFAALLQAVADQPRVLELHFEKIERFNSSTILSIIQLIQAARNRNTPMVVIYDPTRKWQRLSFDALRIFDKRDGLFELRPMEAA
ncbi:MAG TPA: hypothetical protein VM513_08275 [Kofleriaceae bacterium]|nr:hypothetical protein [Kofleriaceae bacterium]